MAITVETQTSSPAPAYRGVYLDCSSNDVDIVRVIMDVSVNGTFKTTQEKDPNFGTNNQFEFDVRDLSQDVLDWGIDFDISTFGIHDQTTAAAQLDFNLFEVLDTTTGTLSTTWAEDGAGTGAVSGSAVDVVNITLQHEETQNLNAYLMDDSTADGLFLTNKPRGSFEIAEDHAIQLDFVSSLADVSAVMEQYQSSTLGTTTQSSALSPTYSMGYVGIDEAFFDSTTDQVKVKLLSTIDEQEATLSETITINKLTGCTDDYRLIYWENPLGGTDYWYFKGNYQKDSEGDFNGYVKPLSRSFSVTDRGEGTIRARSNRRETLWSRELSRDELEWIQEITLQNRNAYIYEGGQFVPIIIEDTSGTYVNNLDTVFQFSLTFRYSNEHISQKGE